MSFIIDTSILIEIENENDSVIQQISKLKDAPKAELCLTVFNFCEFYFGALEKSEKNKEKVKQRLSIYRILHTTERTSLIFCDLLYKLKKKGAVLPHFDIFIAAFALEHDYTLLTADRDFERIPELKKQVFTL